MNFVWKRKIIVFEPHLLTPFLPKQLFPCTANHLEMGWQRRTQLPWWHLDRQLNMTHFEPAAKWCRLRSEGKLLTKHHSRWARVYSIGGQDLQVPVCKSSCWNLKARASLCLGRKDLSRGQIYFWQQCQNHPVLLHLSKIPWLDDGFVQIIWSRMGQHPLSTIIYP